MLREDTCGGNEAARDGAGRDGIMDRLFAARRRLWTLLMDAVS